MTALLLNPWVAIVFYGSILLAVWTMCELSGQIALRRCAEWLVLAWVGSNLIFAWLHAAHAPWLVPIFNAVIAVMIAEVAIVHRSTVAWWIVTLYCVEFSFVVASFLVHRQGGIPYYATLNVVFIGRMIVLGEAALGELASRSRGRAFLAGHRPSGLARRRTV